MIEMTYLNFFGVVFSAAMIGSIMTRIYIAIRKGLGAAKASRELDAELRAVKAQLEWLRGGVQGVVDHMDWHDANYQGVEWHAQLGKSWNSVRKLAEVAIEAAKEREDE